MNYYQKIIEKLKELKDNERALKFIYHLIMKIK